MDEPFANLDERLKEDLQKEVKQLQEQLHMTMIIVSHNQEEAEAMGDVLGILNEGKLMAFGDYDSLYTKPQNVFTANFIGKPKMNFVEGSVEIKRGKMTLQLLENSIPLSVGCPEQEVLIGFRPEDIVLHPVGEFSGFVDHIGRYRHSYLYAILVGKEMIHLISDTKRSVGDMINFDLPFDALHIFNEKGERMEIE